MLAIEVSYDSKTQIVHRDISAGNVMIGEESLKDGEVEVGLLGDWDHANEMIHEDGYICQDSRSVCELSVIPLELYSIAFIRAHGRLCLSLCWKIP